MKSTGAAGSANPYHREQESVLSSGPDRGKAEPGLHCVHAMPFGPRPLAAGGMQGGYEFRLWAPAEKRIEVGLLGTVGGKRYYRCSEKDGWHSCRIDSARPGDLYVFRLASGLEVPDPASRCNPQDVHGPSLLTVPTDFVWDADWAGRPWEEAVIYELHVGTFTPEGRYATAEACLAELAGLGISAIELMPLADFPGRRGWGYDGVLPFAPESSYGTPDELKHFIQAAHRLGLMVFLDVVYNHFGPDGNYLHIYAPQFFTREHQTPWGGAINYAAQNSATVRDFFIHNALYWLEEFRFDGLRLDAVHAIYDRSQPHFLEELSQCVRAYARSCNRHIHLLLENVANESRRLGPPGEPGRYDAQWNDDFHHAAHVVLTGEGDGYYRDFAERPLAFLVRSLAEGFAFQGEYSAFHGRARGERSVGVPASAFVNFLQNHDQVGNRAFGERLLTLVDPQRLRALVALQLLAPSPPLLFMGEEAGALTPFLYFCDFHGELARAVRLGRQGESPEFAQAADRGESALPDPGSPRSFAASKLDWAARAGGAGREWLAFYRLLLGLRRDCVMPLISQLLPARHGLLTESGESFEIVWPTADGAALVLRANLADAVSPLFPTPLLAPFAAIGAPADDPDCLGPWAVRAYVLPAGAPS